MIVEQPGQVSVQCHCRSWTVHPYPYRRGSWWRGSDYESSRDAIGDDCNAAESRVSI